MERFTLRISEHVYYTKGRYAETIPAECETHDVRNILQRLAEYEDIDLTPDEIKTMQAELAEYKNKLADGRMVELPCKEGDYVYCINCYTSKIDTYQVVSFTVICNNEWVIVTRYAHYYPFEDVGKTVFFTKEQAKKALKERVTNER